MNQAAKIMGIVNCTPDSFYDGGRYDSEGKALLHAQRLLDEGADIIDVGGESTRPGAALVSLEEEIARVIPVIQKFADTSDIPVSVDTTKAEVARRAVLAGATIINDISAMTFDPAMLDVAADTGVEVVLMHTKGRPDVMQSDTHYVDIVSEISEYLEERIEAALKAGIQREKIVVDPGIGFGKTVDQNYHLINSISRFKLSGCRVLIGLSRKSLIGAIQKDGEDRLPATLTLNICSVLNGADIIRVHDVKEHRLALDALYKLKSSGAH